VRRRELLGSMLALAAATTLSGCWRPTEELRYRLTVEVETPQGLRTGSSVIEVRGVKNPDWVTPEGRGTRGSYRGEAVAVDLPGGRTLFALLKGDEGSQSDALNYPWLAFRDRLKNSSDFLDELRRLRQLQGEVAELPATRIVDHYENGDLIHTETPSYPLFVTFRDIRDPRSVERVDPNALDKNFGSGIRLRRITVQATDDKLTTGIGKRLKWLPNVYKILHGQDFKPDGIPVGDFKGLFSTELK